MNNQELDKLIEDFFAVQQAILQLNFILSLIQVEIIRLSSEDNNQEEIDDLVQDFFVVTEVILQLTIILTLIQA
ncbi:MAG: hypothetical protein GX957_02875, partial [Clostridiaceae bacterium]|nr:hypothetical protein [Clostridiaceae bacterium]